MIQKKILFITHESSRSGAPMLLLHLLKWLKKRTTDYNVDVLTLRKGHLDSEFIAVADRYDHYFDIFISKFQYYKNRILNLNFDLNQYGKDQFFLKYKSKNYDYIYANSVVSMDMAVKLTAFLPLKPKLICNVHELPTIIDIEMPSFTAVSLKFDLFLAGSFLVANALHEKYNIPESKIKVFYDFTDLSDLPNIIPKEDNLPLVIGGMGTTHWRKGNDLFILIAIFIKKNYSDLNISFLWIGGKPPIEKIILENDLEKSGLNNSYLKFVDASVDYKAMYQEMDVFLLPSREDPFPLVAIEAAACGLPLITFDKATGINEIMEKNKGGGFIVPYLDIQAMAEKIVLYYFDRELLKKDGEINKNSFKEFNVEKAGKEFLQIMKNF